MENENIRSFAQTQIAARLDRLARELRKTARRPDADAVHDLRVAIRRFSQGIVVFESLLPEVDAKKVRKRLKKVMKVAGEVRNRDIALEFFEEAGIGKTDALWKRVVKDRAKDEKLLIERVKKLGRRDPAKQWRSSLGLGKS